LGVILLGLLLVPRPVGAQTGGVSASLYPPELENFPTILTYLDVRDEQGRFVPGLRGGDIRILENLTSLTVDRLEELHPGAQFVVAVASGPSLAIRDGLGMTRYAYLSEALATWANALPAPLNDDLSLVISGGAQVAHTTQVSEWVNALQSHQPDSKAPEASLLPLSQALDIADDVAPRLGMGRAILFITSPQPPEVEAGLQNLVTRAAQEGIRIFVWLAAAPEAFTTPGAQMLADVAAQTGGEFFTFSHDEAIPDPEAYLSPIRQVYQIAYTSRITASGTQEIAAEINTPLLQTISPSRSFELNVSPPNPIFVSPPDTVTRSAVTITSPQGQPTPSEPAGLTPETLPVEILVEFPDGYPRSILTTTLYVDGVQAAQNTEPPFEKFTWDLTPYEESGVHTLRAVAADSLGLSGTTIEISIAIEIIQEQPKAWASVTQQGAVIAAVVVVLAGGILTLVLILGGRIQPRVYGRDSSRRTKRRISERPTQPRPDPLLQPATPTSSFRRPAWLRWPQRPVAPSALAFLTPIPNGDTPHGTPIPLMKGETTLGSSPAHASIVLDDPSISNLHARVRHPAEMFLIYDEGSPAGTWLNYVPVGSEGAPLNHGDLIHFGRLGFRFTLRQPRQVRKPVIRKEAPG